MKEKLFFFSAISALLGTIVGLEKTVIATLFSLVFFIFLYFRFGAKYIVVFFIVFFIFFSNSLFRIVSNHTTFSGKETTFELTFSTIPKIDGKTMTGFATERKHKEKVWLSYTFHSKEEKQLFEKQYYIGKVFRVIGSLQKPKHATVENSFDFSLFLKRKKAHWIVKSTKFEPVLSEKQKLGSVLQLREKAIFQIKGNIPNPLKDYMLALIFGVQNSMSEEEFRNYQKLGVVHLFSISGAQVGMVVLLFYTILQRVGLTQRYSIGVLFLLIPFYAAITGFSPSVNRACGMALLLFLFRFFNKRLTPLCGLCLCLVLYLFIQPFELYSIGFQLSFSICTGLLLTKKGLEQAKQHYVRQMTVSTFICQLSSLPILLYHFYEISIIGFLSNLFYIPLFSFLYFPLTVITYFLFVVFGQKCLFIMEWINNLYHFLTFVSNYFAKIPFSTINFGKPSGLILLCIVILTILLFTALEYGRKFFFNGFGLLLCLVLFIQYHGNMFFSKGELTFVDVGQGDAILIQLPHNKGNYLIDTGGVFSFQKEDWEKKENEFDTGKDILLPLLKSKGIHQLDKLILTHADMDHIGGAFAILEQYPVKEVLLPVGQEQEYEKVGISKKKGKGYSVKYVGEGYGWSTGKCSFQVLHPNGTNTDKNSSSIVLFANINGLRILLMGDGDVDTEQCLMEKYDLEVDILKVGHHGSKTSTGKPFVKYLHPQYAVISVGEKNRYGHPNTEVIQTLVEKEIQILRTDEMGSITFELKNGTIYSFPPYHTRQEK